MKLNSNYVQFASTSLALIGVAMAFTRCSPVSSSLSKAGLGAHISTLSPLSGADCTGSKIHILNFKSRVTDNDGVKAALDAKSDHSLEVRLSDKELVRLLTTGTTDVKIDSKLSPLTVQALVEFKGSRSDITPEETDTVDLSLKLKDPKNPKLWTVQLSGFKEENSEGLQDRLSGVTLLVTLDSAPAPSPLPSPLLSK